MSNHDIAEWTASKRWNPFNSYKLLTQVNRWENIHRGRSLPPPALVTIDPCNRCNLNCAWCNAGYIRGRNHGEISGAVLQEIASFLSKWEWRNVDHRFKVEAICVAGGGEPLLNKNTYEFIDRITAGHVIQAGIVTNGVLLDEAYESISRCTWAGISVDAASSRVFNKLKGLPDNSDVFNKILNNIQNLCDYARCNESVLGKENPSYGVSYKYLLYKENIGEIFAATRLAKELGCKNIHFRPAGTPWSHLGQGEKVMFTADDIALFEEQISMAQELEQPNFGVYGVTHKFNSQFGISNLFQCCHAIFMTGVFMPPDDGSTGAYTFGLCCDRRGDTQLNLLANQTDVEAVGRAWGADAHWRIHDDIKVHAQCPRCTYQPHNQIYEQVILKDSMTYKFI